jgi:glycosyltransferase involved in cell wall biosynthesis
MIQNRFIIITPSFNNEEWVEYNIASILNQTYTNFKVLYIDDCSTDNTYDKVKSIVETDTRFTVIRNETNKGAAYNYIEYVDSISDDDNDILVHLDGDDWFYDDHVLENLNKLYNEKDYWMTYGRFMCYDGTNQLTESTVYGVPHDDFIHDNKLYRRDQFKASHLRTYRSFLFKKIDKNDLKSLETKEYYWHAIDVAWGSICLEMCPKDKIGVPDFFTCVYNMAPKNYVRSQERQAPENHKFEIEIRNRKKYKEGLSGEKLPLINVIYDYMEYWTFPTEFSYCYNQTDGEFDLVLIGDQKIENFIQGEFNIKRNVPIVARLMEHRSYWGDRIFNLVKENYQKFHTIFTHDKELLETLPNTKFMPTTDVIRFNTLPNPYGTPVYKALPTLPSYEMPKDLFQIYPKTKLVSVTSSDKTFLPGHRERLKMLDSIKDKIDVFGTAQLALYNQMIRHERKFESLKDYAFSLAIENLSNDVDDYYFSEKITDCFITGTIPIYYGCPNIGKFFNLDGILIFNTVEELHNIIDNLSIDLYLSKMEAIKDNFQRSFQTPLTNDLMYELYFKQIIDKK